MLHGRGEESNGDDKKEREHSLVQTYSSSQYRHTTPASAVKVLYRQFGTAGTVLQRQSSTGAPPFYREHVMRIGVITDQALHAILHGFLHQIQPLRVLAELQQAEHSCQPHHLPRYPGYTMSRKAYKYLQEKEKTAFPVLIWGGGGAAYGDSGRPYAEKAEVTW